jgi:hypothetical protein
VSDEEESKNDSSDIFEFLEEYGYKPGQLYTTCTLLDQEKDFENSIACNDEKEPMNITDFKLCNIPEKQFLGQGSFGKVYLAKLIGT